MTISLDLTDGDLLAAFPAARTEIRRASGKRWKRSARRPISACQHECGPLTQGQIHRFPRSPEIRIGYARVSTRGQNLDRQIDLLTAAGCRRIFGVEEPGNSRWR